MNVLIIDDDAPIATLLCRALRESGYQAESAATATEALLQLERAHYTGIVLDIGLPDRSGVSVLRAIRERGDQTPVLCLTGAGDDELMIEALDAGADDFAHKPIRLGIFLARIRALTRRGPAARSTPMLRLGNLELNRLTHTVTCDGHSHEVTRKEFAVLEYFLLRPGALVTRTELLHDVWGLSFDTGTNLIDVHMSRVRRVLREAGATLEFITLRGQGFVLRSIEAPAVT